MNNMPGVYLMAQKNHPKEKYNEPSGGNEKVYYLIKIKFGWIPSRAHISSSRR